MAQNNFSLFEATFIRHQLTKKTDDEIAWILQRPVEDVRERIAEITGGGTIMISKSQAVAKRQEKQAIKKQAAALKVKNAEIARQQYKKSKEAGFRPKKPVEKTFDTKIVDYTKKKYVRVDSKTTICVDVHIDNDVAIARYKALMEKKASNDAGNYQNKNAVRKECKRCKEKKILDAFPFNKKSPDKKGDLCNKCTDMLQRIDAHEKKHLYS